MAEVTLMIGKIWSSQKVTKFRCGSSGLFSDWRLQIRSQRFGNLQVL